jgi:hypothetical protein
VEPNGSAELVLMGNPRALSRRIPPHLGYWGLTWTCKVAENPGQGNRTKS